MSDDLVQSVEQKVCERWYFTISELLYEFSQILRTLLYEIITAWLLEVLCEFRKCSRVHMKCREWVQL
jgi:hypothetical protein